MSTSPTTRNTELVHPTITSVFFWLHHAAWLCSFCDCLNMQDFIFLSLFTLTVLCAQLFHQGWHKVCNHWVSSFHTSYLPVIWVLRVEPSLRRSWPWNTAFPCCDVPFIKITHSSHFLEPYVEESHTRRKFLCWPLQSFFQPAQRSLPMLCLGLHSKCCPWGFFATLPWLFWLLLC